MAIDDRQPRPDLRDRPTGALVNDVSELVPRLVRQELQLAKAELSEKGKRAGVGAGLLGGSGVVAWFGVAVLVAAAVLGLAEAMPAWASALVVGAVLLLVAGVLALAGRSQVKQAVPPLPQEAVASTKDDVRAVKESAHR
jgi:membrane protein